VKTKRVKTNTKNKNREHLLLGWDSETQVFTACESALMQPSRQNGREKLE